jgi:hypothetical protein
MQRKRQENETRVAAKGKRTLPQKDQSVVLKIMMIWSKNATENCLIECLRISSRTVFETEYDVNSDLFRIRNLCLRFLIYELLEIFRIDNQHGLCAKKCLKAGRIFIRHL